MSESNNNHTVDLEVTGGQIPLIRGLLNQVELSSSISRIRIEIESPKPFLRTDDLPEEADVNNQETEQPAEEEPEEEEPEEEKTKQPHSVDTGPSAESAHPTSKLVPSNGSDHSTDDDDAAPETEVPDGTGRPARDYLDSKLVDDVAGAGPDEFPEPKDFADIITAPLNPDTNKWKVMGLLYRTQGSLSAKQIAKMLEDTAWEMPQASIYSTLHQAKNDGYINNEEYGEYQLTQLGRDFMKARVTHMKGYKLKLADKLSKDVPSV